MENIRKVFKWHSKDGHKGHEKIKDKKTQEKDAVQQGVKFYVDYIGSTLVEELEEGQSYGDKISAKAVKAIHEMAKAGHRKCHKVEVCVSVNGIKVLDTENDVLLTSLSIYRIHFCTADKHHDHIFAYIARSTENETMECHAFQCPRRKTAQTMALTVAQGFQLAKEEYERKIEEKDRLKLNADFPPTITESSNHSTECSERVVLQEEVRTGAAVDRGSGDPQRTAQCTNTDTKNTTPLGFEDNFADIQCPTRSLPLRGTPDNHKGSSRDNPFRNSTFNVGVEVEELNNSLLEWLESEQAKQSLCNNNNNLTQQQENLIEF